MSVCKGDMIWDSSHKTLFVNLWWCFPVRPAGALRQGAVLHGSTPVFLVDAGRKLQLLMVYGRGVWVHMCVCVCVHVCAPSLACCNLRLLDWSPISSPCDSLGLVHNLWGAAVWEYCQGLFSSRLLRHTVVWMAFLFPSGTCRELKVT